MALKGIQLRTLTEQHHLGTASHPSRTKRPSSEAGIHGIPRKARRLDKIYVETQGWVSRSLQGVNAHELQGSNYRAAPTGATHAAPCLPSSRRVALVEGGTWLATGPWLGRQRWDDG